MSNSQKLCTSCKQWTVWNKHDEDLCSHCGARLIPQELVDAEAQRIEKINNTQVGLFQINPEDGGFINSLKRMGNITHFIFAAFVSLIVWFISMVAP